MIYASGHEHNQQIHTEVNNILINSGNLQKGSFSPKDHSTIFNSKRPGFIRIEYENTGSVSSSFIDLKEPKNISQQLYASACQPGAILEKIDENSAFIPCQMSEELPNEQIIPEKTLVSPGKGYQSNFIKNLFLGKHHRSTWNTPVSIPYLKISRPSVDLSPTKSNNGKQTLTLKFKDENENRYTFRSIDKEPRKALNYELRKSIIGTIFEDQTSAQHPFGALPAARLLDHLDILHTNPKLYVLPNSKALGPFQKNYGGMLGMLEENPGRQNEKGVYFANADDIIKSNELFNELYEDLDHKVISSEFLRARLFDILIGDWNKGKHNWRWAEYKSDKSKVYRPIPRNRDKAFSSWDGLLPWLADREWALPNTEGFDYDIKGFRSAVFKARHLDRFLLTEATWSDYVEQVEWIKEALTDENIVEAVNTMPQESFAITGEKIISKLIYRRDHLSEHARKFYTWLNQDVAILGSAKDDYFEIYEQGDSLIIEIWNEKKFQKGDKRKYRRGFLASETDRLRIYGLGEEDIYNVRLTQDPGIELVLLGGEQTDQYRIEEAHDFLQVIDDKVNIDTLTTNKIELSDNWHRKRYIYNRNGLKFNSYVPLVYVGYNQFFGTTLSVTNTWTRQRWDKPDYHSKHKLRFNISTMGDLGLKYTGLSRHSLNQWDYTWKLTVANPDFFDSYYGLGNFSRIDPVLDQQNFYLISYSNYNSLLGLRRKFWDQSIFSIESGYDFYQNEQEENNILSSETSLLGANERLGIVPIKSALDIDFRNDRDFSTQGNRLMLEIYQGWINNRDWKSFSTIGLSVEQYISTYNSRPFTLGLKAGGAKGIGSVPFYLFPRLGGNNLLRGYTSNRFFGRSSLYFNSELRWRILKKDSAAIPFEFGISTFYDIGKVSDKETDNSLGTKWHKGYGGGIFVIPFNEKFTMSLYMTWSEENSFYPRFTFGSALN